MSIPNTFTDSMETYFDIVKGPTGAVTHAGVFTSDDVVADNEMLVQGIPGAFLKMGTGIQTSFIDFGSNFGTGPDVFDSRIMSTYMGEPDKNDLTLETDGTIKMLSPLSAGGGRAFYLDYGQIGPIQKIVNPQQPITFAAGLFSTTPIVTVTMSVVGTTELSQQLPVFVESTTPTGCTTQVIGDLANPLFVGTYYINWIAMGV